MIALKSDSQSSGNKKIHCKTQHISFSRFNVEFEGPYQNKKKSIRSKTISKNQHVLESIDENHNNNIFEVRRIDVKRNTQKITKSLEKQNSRKILNQKSFKNEEKLKAMNPISLNRNDQKKLSLNQKRLSQKHQFRVVELLNFCKNNNSKVSDCDSTENRPSSETEKNLPRANSLEIKETKAYRRTSFKASQKSKKRQSLPKFKPFIDIKNSRINITSNVCRVTIPPRGQKKSIETQTIQSESQFFEYLTYKRKKQQCEEQLRQFFQEIKILEQDRKQSNQRKTRILDIYTEAPEDEREKQIFRLKQHVDKSEHNVRIQVDNKCKLDEAYVKGIYQIEDAYLEGLNKLDDTMKNYLLVFKQLSLKNNDQKYIRIIERLENLTSHIISEVNNQIQLQIKKFKSYKVQSYNLRNAFNEYIDSNNEYKQLLRNCFQRLKKTPQLCYELIGENSPENYMNLKLIDENSKFQKPKCVQCFNTNWKLHIVAEQNLLMKSILKVSHELLR